MEQDQLESLKFTRFAQSLNSLIFEESLNIYRKRSEFPIDQELLLENLKLARDLYDRFLHEGDKKALIYAYCDSLTDLVGKKADAKANSGYFAYMDYRCLSARIYELLMKN